MVSCDSASDPEPPPPPRDGVYRLAVVVHIVHHGEPVGVGHNLSLARIEGQIESLNDDYRRREGTRGFNTHPDGADARVEFVLARTAPDGTATTGIVRVNATEVDNPVEGNGLFERFAFYGYWPPEHYLNVWTMPLPPSTVDVVLGLNWTADRCVNTLTADQVSRMHHVLEHSPRRRTLAGSPDLAVPNFPLPSILATLLNSHARTP